LYLLKKLAFKASVDVQAYEQLAIYGTNLAELKLETGATAQPAENVSFGSSALIYDGSFKQQRKLPLRKLIWSTQNLEVRGLAKFLSCFGKIDELTVELYPLLLVEAMNVQNYDEIPTYHAVKVRVRLPATSFPQLNSSLLAVTHSCRSMRELWIGSNHGDPSPCLLDAPSLIACAYACSLKNSLISLYYPNGVNLPEPQLKQMLPMLKMRSYHRISF
jgi:hypothetical protein